ELAARDLEKAAEACELWRQAYPRDIRPVFELGAIYSYLGDHERSLHHAREAMKLGGKSLIYYLNLAFEYASLNRFDEAEAVYKETEELKFANEGLLFNRYQLAFVKGDAAQMTKVLAAAAGKPGVEEMLLAAQADTE